jgi:hypothetical protein
VKISFISGVYKMFSFLAFFTAKTVIEAITAMTAGAVAGSIFADAVKGR